MTLMHSWLIRVTLVAGKVFAHKCDTENHSALIQCLLKHCATNRKRQLSGLPNAGPYIYDISRLRVKETGWNMVDWIHLTEYKDK